MTLKKRIRRKDETLGSYFKRLRQEALLSQKQVAEHFGWTTAQFVSNIERDVCPPPDHFVKEIASLYSVSREDLVAAMVQECRDRYEELFHVV